MGFNSAPSEIGDKRIRARVRVIQDTNPLSETGKPPWNCGLTALEATQLSRHSCLSLTQELSHVYFYSTKKSWGKTQAFESCSRLTFTWINCQLDSLPLSWIGSTHRSEIIWPKHIYLSLIRYRDIALCEKSEKWNYLKIHRIISKDLQRSRFFMRH
jgi:hypothetical protein